jgi:hypothetical protein
MKAFDFSSLMRGIPTLSRLDPRRDLCKSERARAVARAKEAKGRESKGLKSLAEAIILQSIEDLWSKTNRKKSIEFFTGEGFSQCADMAGMGVIDRLRLLRILRRIDAEAFDSRHSRKIRASGIGREEAGIVLE